MQNDQKKDIYTIFILLIIGSLFLYGSAFAHSHFELESYFSLAYAPRKEAFAFLIPLIFGLIFCSQGISTTIEYFLEKIISSYTTKNRFLKNILHGISFLFFPIFMIVVSLIPTKKLVVHKRKHFLKKVFLFIVSFTFLIPLWIGLISLGWQTLYDYYIFREDPVYLSATGSMYPTFPMGDEDLTIQELSKTVVGTAKMKRYPTGFNLFNKHYFNYELMRGDIVSFYNEKTAQISRVISGESRGFIKRIVALPGDIVELRDGIFYLNGIPQKEAYVASAHSTFGGEFLPDCVQKEVPEGHVFVMGDNRKISNDSRYELGLVAFSDIDHVLPLEDQIGQLDANWHNPENDLDESAKIKLDIGKYVKLLNDERVKLGVEPLSYQTILERSATKRAQSILSTSDFSFEGNESGYSMADALNEVGYSNKIWGEYPIQGYFTADELFENQNAFSASRKFLLNGDFDEIGISVVSGDLDGCPTQIIVQHLGGYIPPDYSKETINSWKLNLENLASIKPSWERIKDSPGFYEENKQDVDRINEIIDIRISRITQIITRMEANEWLTAEEETFIDQESELAKEQSDLAHKINSR